MPTNRRGFDSLHPLQFLTRLIIMPTTIESIHAKISELKTKRNAVILAHNYQLPEVQEIADLLGDSLMLSQKAAATKADEP